MENISDAGLVLFHNSFSKRGLLHSALAAAECSSNFVLSIEDRTFYKAYYSAAVVAKLSSDAAEAYAYYYASIVDKTGPMENISDAGLVLFHNSFSKRGLLHSALAAAECTSNFVLSIKDRIFYKAYDHAAVVAKLSPNAAETYAYYYASIVDKIGPAAAEAYAYYHAAVVAELSSKSAEAYAKQVISHHLSPTFNLAMSNITFLTLPSTPEELQILTETIQQHGLNPNCDVVVFEGPRDYLTQAIDLLRPLHTELGLRYKTQVVIITSKDKDKVGKTFTFEP
jgi:hypothetical protein